MQLIIDLDKILDVKSGPNLYLDSKTYTLHSISAHPSHTEV